METPTISAMAYSSRTSSSDDFLKMIQDAAIQQHPAAVRPVISAQIQQEKPMSTARIVKVFIADSNENLPLEKRVLYEGDQKLTDLTDQELFFEVPIAEVLAKHNTTRAATVDKKQAEKFGRDIFLEPARIRDLKMVVVTVASF